ncbi:hypothetical protein AURDEDRAFT_183932 [Auricularia subglabra TFB-10046 SS5]|nr:hypothetical protein AURDEDRAFT_183932 [Auricularia subglabra TFB-10046 SS5]
MTCLHDGGDLQAAIDTLTKHVNLPNTTTKSGLRKVARGMDEFGPDLVAYYRRALKMDDDHALAAVAIVWSRICVDMRLRVETLEDFVPPKVLCSFIQPHRCTMCIVAGLHLINIVIPSVIKEQFDRNLREVLPAVVKTLTHVGSYNLVSELAMKVVHHFSAFVTISLKDPVVQNRFVLDVLRCAPTLPLPLFKRAMHSVSFAITAIQGHAGHENLDPVITGFLVGLFRAGYPRARRFAVRWLGQVADHMHAAQKSKWNPGRVMTNGIGTFHSLPPMVLDRMRDFGLERCDSFRLQRSMADFVFALAAFTVNKDLVALGFRIFGLLQEDPDSVCFDKTVTDKASIGNCTPRRWGVPCDTWDDILLHCASAVRRSRQPDLIASVSVGRTPGLPLPTVDDVADVLLIRHTFSTRDLDERFRVCQVMINRDSCFEVYAAYAMTSFGPPRASHAGMHVLGVASNKKSPVFQRAMANYCDRLFMHIFCNLGEKGSERNIYGDEGDWDEVCEDTILACRICDAYLDHAPPDARDRATVSEIAIILHLFMDGPKPPNAARIKESFLAWQLAVETNRILWGGAFRDNTLGVLELISKHYFEKAEDWHATLRRIVSEGYKSQDDFRDPYDPPVQIEVPEPDALRWRQRVFVPASEDARFDWKDVPATVFDAFAHPTLRYKTIPHCGAWIGT